MSNGKGKERAEVLDVEDDDERQARMLETLQRLDTSRSAHTSQNQFNIPNLSNLNSRPTDVDPPLELLSRVQAFLPQLAASNAELARKVHEDPASVDIEAVQEDECYIEMNLGLGVFEQRKADAARDTDTDTSSEESDSESGTSDDSSEESESSSSDESMGSDEDDDEGHETAEDLIARVIRPLPKRATRSNIVVLEDGSKPKAEEGAKGTG